MTPLLDYLEKLEKRATPGPWRWWADDDSQLNLTHGEDDDWVLSCTRCDSCIKRGADESEDGQFRCRWPRLKDSALLAELRNHAPLLIAEIRRLVKLPDIAKRTKEHYDKCAAVSSSDEDREYYESQAAVAANIETDMRRALAEHERAMSVGTETE